MINTKPEHNAERANSIYIFEKTCTNIRTIKLIFKAGKTHGNEIQLITSLLVVAHCMHDFCLTLGKHKVVSGLW